MASTADRLEFSALERRVLAWLAVPSDPEVPEGTTASVQVFRSGANYYVWLVLVWAAACVFIAFWLAMVTFGMSRGLTGTPEWAQVLFTVLLTLAWITYACGVIVTFIARRLNFRLRWYIVTDRSLRIRSGVFAIKELTMTYRNVQEIRVTAGLLENALKLATVEVHAAGGGGGGQKQGGSGHVGRLEGLSNATEIRDVLVERLRQYRDAGLGDHAPAPATAPDAAAGIDAARAVLAEARALRESLARDGRR